MRKCNYLYCANKHHAHGFCQAHYFDGWIKIDPKRHECFLKKQRSYRKLTHNAVTSRYEKTLGGFLVRLYRNMKSRITGVQRKKRHLYYGKSLLSKKSFYIWAKESKDLKIMFNNWAKSGHDRKLTPTVNRINSAIGYELDNMEWLTHSENSRLGAINRNRIK